MPAAMSRIPLIAGNWKMHTSLEEARILFAAVVEALDEVDPRPSTSNASGAARFDVAVFPPAISLAAVAAAAAKSSRAILVGAQNMHDASHGPFTGEISAAMIVSCGARGVLLGHSERRQEFGESDDFVGRKVAAALAAGLTPVLCVGETIGEREADKTLDVVGRQLAAGIAAVETAGALARLIIAYEPVWAIGTKLTASPEQAQEVHAFIRVALGAAIVARGGRSNGGQSNGARSNSGRSNGKDAMRILYGGSVKPENAAELLAQPDIDGALVGGASLKAESFAGICAAVGATV